MSDEMILSNLPTEIPVTITDKDGERHYILTELTGPNGVKYSNIAAGKANTEILADGTVKFLGMKEGGEMDTILVSLCLYHRDSRTLVDESVVRGFKHQITDMLAKKARTINGMDPIKKSDDKKTEDKKDSDAKN